MNQTTSEAGHKNRSVGTGNLTTASLILESFKCNEPKIK